MRDLPKLAARDLGILAVAVLVWWLVADASAESGALGDFTGFTAGLLLGATSYIVHEWGHLLGALATRSKVRIAQTLRSAFVFSFDTRENSLAQFLVMSFSGFVATGLVVWAFYTYLPDGLLATRIARGAVLFGVFLTVVLEVPLVAIAIRKRAVPAVAAVRVSRRRASIPA